MINIAILASGSGSNAEKLMEYFANHSLIKITLLGSNKEEALALTKAKRMNVESWAFSNNDLKNGVVLHKLKEKKIDYIILAGFLALIPKQIIQAYPEKIINIHPSLLPNFGGKGMYGMNVHNAVKKAQKLYSGLTVHLVNEEFDQGKILFQARVKLQDLDTEENIAQKVLQLEHRYFSSVVESYCLLFAG